MSSSVTALVLSEADTVLGSICELLVECMEATLPPLKEYLTIRGLNDFGPIIPEWSGPTTAQNDPDRK